MACHVGRMRYLGLGTRRIIGHRKPVLVPRLELPRYHATTRLQLAPFNSTSHIICKLDCIRIKQISSFRLPIYL